MYQLTYQSNCIVFTSFLKFWRLNFMRVHSFSIWAHHPHSHPPPNHHPIFCLFFYFCVVSKSPSSFWCRTIFFSWSIHWLFYFCFIWPLRPFFDSTWIFLCGSKSNDSIYLSFYLLFSFIFAIFSTIPKLNPSVLILLNFPMLFSQSTILPPIVFS